MCRSHTISFCISLRENCSLCSSIFSVSMEEVNSGTSYVTILVWSTPWEDNFKAYVLYCLPNFLRRIKHQLPTVVICLKMCPLLAKCPSLFYFPISLLAFSPSPNYTISTSILISESISKITQTKTPMLILSHSQTLDLNW